LLFFYNTYRISPCGTSYAEVGLFVCPDYALESLKAASLKLAAFLFEIIIPLAGCRCVVVFMGEVYKYTGEGMVVVSKFKPRIGGN
jgi:hypothetical protein